jgi:hypothetical protein
VLREFTSTDSRCRSVHNTRIERMWGDVTQAFGSKWKTFFLELEEFHGLVPTREGHIWLLHHLFLHEIDSDTQDFVDTWNHHKMQIRGQRSASPREMFFFGMMHRGSRGVDDIANFEHYGVDWEDYNDPVFMRHLHEANPNDSADVAVFRAPEHIATVYCEPPNCPLTALEVQTLDNELRRWLGAAHGSRDMSARRAMWQSALNIVVNMIRAGSGTHTFVLPLVSILQLTAD